MKVLRTIAEVRSELGPPLGQKVGLVPTMGALHEGHISLVRLAHEHSDLVVVSIFVNPLQFGPSEDLDRYPRTEDADLVMTEEAGAGIVFLPLVDEMYPQGASTTVHVGGVSEVLEGSFRPGHFDGVATVVSKLFNIVRPDVAVFGQKDAQQVAVIRKMVEDLDMGIEIVVAPTVREPDGLALSSRNRYLSPSERERAVALSRALQRGRDRLLAGEAPAEAETEMVRTLRAAEVDIDYTAAVDPHTFGPAGDGDVLLAVAGRVGSTRLIDNMTVQASERGTASGSLQ